MPQTPDKRYASEVERPLDPCFVETENLSADGKKIHVIRASRLIVLCPAGTHAPTENTVVAAAGEHLEIYGDRVRIAGRIHLPSLNVSIACRELEFAADGMANPEIDVSGVDGETKPSDIEVAAAAAGPNGTSERPAGDPGTKGNPGKGGAPGQPGGKVQIVCLGLKALAPVTIQANGGNGAAGCRGQQGGSGGTGWPGDPNAGARLKDSGPEGPDWKGGAGGAGGSGGNGGAGGDGGSVEIWCLEPQSSSSPLTLSVIGGNGGGGGEGGDGGSGGDGATPLVNSTQKANNSGGLPNPYGKDADGGWSGDGGPPGGPGYGGDCGNPGSISLRTGSLLALQYPAKAYSQPASATFRLNCRSGAVGKPPTVGASWGTAGTPGKAAHSQFMNSDNGVDGRAPDPKSRTTEGIQTAVAPYRHGPLERRWQLWEGEPILPPLPTRRAKPKLPPGMSERKANLVFEDRMADWAESEKEYLRCKAEADKTIKAETIIQECWKPVDLPQIGARQDTAQLQMLYDHVRTRCLLAPTGSPLALPNLKHQLAWLAAASSSKLDLTRPSSASGDPDTKRATSTTPADVYHLFQSASTTYGNLLTGKNLFGHDDKYVVLGRLKSQVDAMEVMRKNLQDTEALADQSTRFSTMESSWKASQQLTQNKLSTIRQTMSKALDDPVDGIRAQLNAAVSEIAARQKVQDGTLTALNAQVADFGVEIEQQVGLTLTDFFGFLNQLSFTNRDISENDEVRSDGTTKVGSVLLGGAMATGAMLLSQVGDLATKAMDNAVDDYGQPQNKKYIVRKVASLSAQLPTLTDLKQESDGTVTRQPEDEVRLLATAEQFNSLLESFYKSTRNGRKVANLLNAHVKAVQARNKSVDEWNRLLASYAYCIAERRKAIDQSAAIDSTVGNNPGLVALASFSATLNRHALEDYLRRLYDAGRVCTLHTLRQFDPLASLAAAARESDADIGFLNSGILAQAVSGFIGATLDAASSTSDRTDLGCIDFELTATSQPLLFRLLTKLEPATFRVPAPSLLARLPGSTPPLDPQAPAGEVNVFALKADVRLTHIIPSILFADGQSLAQRCSQCTVILTHSGMETFLRPDGVSVDLDHLPMTVQCDFKDGMATTPDFGALDSVEHAGLIGPFCDWQISIPENGLVFRSDLAPELKTLNGLQTIRIRFKGTCRAFNPAAFRDAKEDAKAIPAEVGDEDFASNVLQSHKPVVVEFRSDPSTASTAFESLRSEVKRSYTGQIRFASLNVADTENTGKTYEQYKALVPHLPALAIFSRGRLLKVLNGLALDEVSSTLRSFLGQAEADG